MKWKSPTWFNKIPYGSHGSTPTQKRYWKLVSDLVRIFDFYKYGQCVSCGKHMNHWSEGDCGHFKAFTLCNSYFKFDFKNLALQCKGCNKLGSGDTGHRFGEELKRRHGKDILDEIEKENNNYRGQKIEDFELVSMAELVIQKMKTLDEQPEYYIKVVDALDDYLENLQSIPSR